MNTNQLIWKRDCVMIVRNLFDKKLIKKFNKDREIIENIKNTIKLRLKKNFKII
jgi:hypothetical protein